MATTPGAAEPRFPGYDVTEQSSSWDGVTTAVVLGRLSNSGQPTFFRPDEEPTARALLDRLLAQNDDPRVPVFEMIDARLTERRGDGFRYDDMPDDPQAWRQSIAGLEATSETKLGKRFAAATAEEQREIIEEVRLCQGRWQGLPADRVFSLWMRYACSAFYAHPWTWNEIGFGGPAYPRGYKHLALDGREPWEVAERAAKDPVPWATQAEAAKRRHAEGLPESPASPDNKGQR